MFVRIASVALVACVSAEPRAPANRAVAGQPLLQPIRCGEPPERDHLEKVASFALDVGCVALANHADGPIEKWPVVWVWEDPDWRLIRLENYTGYEWKGAVSVGGEVVGVLDNAVESPGWELAITATTDGRAWSERSRLRKAYYFAVVAAVGRDDRGITIAVDLDDDYGAGVKPGRTIYRSTDAGRSWSGFRVGVP